MPQTTRSSAGAQQVITAQPQMPTAEPTITIVPTALPTPEFTNQPREDFQQMANDWSIDLTILDMENTGIWQFAEGSLLHPVAIEIANGSAFIVDGGRVLSFDLMRPGLPQLLLAPGDQVEGVQVLEPLDLAISGDELVVLDRAGDVYTHSFPANSWRLERYDRPVESSSGHYFVALAADYQRDSNDRARALLETNYKFAELTDNERDQIWNLPDLRGVDIAYGNGDTYVLQREFFEQAGQIKKYRDTATVGAFTPAITVERPRQLAISSDGLYVLDQGGSRLLLLDPQDGTLRHIFQLPLDPTITAVASDPDSDLLILAGKDHLFFLGDPAQRVTVTGWETEPAPQSNDPAVLSSLNTFIVPIGGSNITFRDFQLPGAPRHYRLGVHQGLDFYWQPGTKIQAIGDGKIIRVDNHYLEPTAQDLAAWRESTIQNGFTPDAVLDKYLGRQIWVEHKPGIVSRYAHLRSLEPGLAVGDTVARGQILGEVGNSGSPASLEGESSDAHLHFELWINDTFLGQFMRPMETRDWVETIFPVSR